MGRFYLFDHLGNIVAERLDSFPPHMVSINQISVDDKGEYVAACSDEGRFTINGLYATENDQRVVLPSPVRCIQLDPQFSKSGTGRRFITGDSKLTLYEKTFYKSLKSTVLCQSQGMVSALEWCDQYVAWASGLGVHVYNLVDKCSLGLIRWEDPVNSSLDDFRCNLRWANATTLLIGWVDTIRICVLRKSKDMAGTIVDPSRFLYLVLLNSLIIHNSSLSFQFQHSARTFTSVAWLRWTRKSWSCSVCPKRGIQRRGSPGDHN